MFQFSPSDPHMTLLYARKYWRCTAALSTLYSIQRAMRSSGFIQITWGSMGVLIIPMSNDGGSRSILIYGEPITHLACCSCITSFYEVNETIIASHSD